MLVVLAAVVAVSTSSGGLGGTTRDGTAKISDLLWRVALGGLIGLSIGLAVLAALHRAAPSRPPIAKWLYGVTWSTPGVGQQATVVTAPRSWRKALRRVLPFLLLLIAVGALIAASTTPLQTTTSMKPPSPSAGEAEDGKPTEVADGRYVTSRDGTKEIGRAHV